MNWLVVAASEVGTAHLLDATPCQDEYWAQAVSQPGGAVTLAIFVADGAGSATRAAEGAESAIEAAAEFLRGATQDAALRLEQGVAEECVAFVRGRIQERAKREALSARDFACTFLGVLSSLDSTLVFQIGDGGIVIDVGNGLEVPIVPMSGEYVNTTHFITDDDAPTVMISKLLPARALKAAAFTDGIQRLALNMAANTAHEPFFAPFFKIMSTATPDQEDALSSALRTFLRSAPVNERTDDDKTLILALVAE